uniref:Uncharacterized protein n=1 Tax=Onchocerca volvulus TaxID=6282 RepID=A0A8R1Y7K9_ONCVO
MVWKIITRQLDHLFISLVTKAFVLSSSDLLIELIMYVVRNLLTVCDVNCLRCCKH